MGVGSTPGFRRLRRDVDVSFTGAASSPAKSVPNCSRSAGVDEEIEEDLSDDCVGSARIFLNLR